MQHHPQQYPHSPRARPPAVLILAVVGLALLIVAAALAWLYREWTILELTAPQVAAAIRLAVFLLPLGFALMVGAIIWRRYGWVESVRSRHSVEQTRARVQVAPLATSYTYHYEPETIEGTAEALALPPPIDVLQPLDAWLKWADEQPHVLLGGKTKAGKTTTATAILARRLRNREQVFIIDPHSSDWLGLPTAGRTSRQGELERALLAVLAEYMKRMAEREAHKARDGRELAHNHYTRLTVLIDEANAIADMLPIVWATVVKQLASGSRKVGISLLLLAQSPLVEDLKISGGMRENFARIALDQLTVQRLIDTVRDKDRKSALNDTLPDLDWPAAAQIGSQIWLLDRDGMGHTIEPADSAALVWSGWDYASGMAKGAETPGQQELVSAGVFLPNAIGGVRLAWCVAKMLDRGKAPAEIAPILASLVLRVAPEADRAAVEQELAQRAARLLSSGNAATIAAQLDRDALIKTCMETGAGINLAFAIYGGNRKDFLTQAKQIGTVVP